MKRITRAVRENRFLAEVVRMLPEADDLYLVGGAVRDFAFGIRPVEYDFVSRHPSRTAKTVAERIGKKAFRLGKSPAFIYRVPLDGGGMDFSLLSERSIHDNLSKRDFTVNSLGVHLKSGTVFDPSSGLEDARDWILRMGYAGAFADDPLRIVKGYRMRSLYSFLRWEKNTRASAGMNCPMLDSNSIPPERIRQELALILGGRAAAHAVGEMSEDGIFAILFPELERLRDIEQSAPHKADVFSHTLDMLELLDENLLPFSGSSIFNHSADDILKLRLAVLFHDSGKACCFSREGKKIRFLGHEKESAAKARACLSRLRFSNTVVNEVSSLCGLHMRPLLLQQEGSPSISARRRLIRDAGGNIHILMMLSLLDFSSMERSPEEVENYWNFCQGIFDLVEKEGPNIIDPPKLIGGLEALAILGLEKPGPELGKALIALSYAQTDGDIRSEKEAVSFLKEYERKFLKN